VAASLNKNILQWQSAELGSGKIGSLQRHLVLYDGVYQM
jgi:hypothetical protein